MLLLAHIALDCGPVVQPTPFSPRGVNHHHHQPYIITYLHQSSRKEKTSSRKKVISSQTKQKEFQYQLWEVFQ